MIFFGPTLDFASKVVYDRMVGPWQADESPQAMKRTATTMTGTTTTKVAADSWFAPIMAHVCPC